MAGPTIGELAAGITLDTSRFEKGITATRAEIAAAGRTVAAAQTPLENYAKEIDKLDAQFRKGLILMETHTRAVRQAEDAYRDSIPEAELVGEKTGLLAGKMALINPAAIAASVGIAALGTAAAVAGKLLHATFENAIEQVEQLDRIGDFSVATGFGTEALTGLEYAATQSGGSIEGLEKAVKKFSVGLGSGSKEFQKLGLSVSELQKMRPEDAFLKTIDALNKIESPTERAAASAKLFGKSWSEVAGLIAEGSEGIATLLAEAEAFGGIISDSDVAGVQEMQDSLDQIGFVWESIGKHLAAEFAPVVGDIADTMLDMVKTGGQLQGVFHAMGVAAEIAAQNMRNIETAAGFIEDSPVLKQILENLTLGAKGSLLKDLIGGAIGELDFEPPPDHIPGDPRFATDLAPSLIDGEADRADALAEAAQKIADGVATPGEKLQKELDHLAEVFESGLLPVEKYNLAIEKAQKDFADDSGLTKQQEAAAKVIESINDKMLKDAEKFVDARNKQIEKEIADNAKKAEKIAAENLKIMEATRSPDEILEAVLMDLEKRNLDPKTLDRANRNAFDDFRKESEKSFQKPEGARFAGAAFQDTAEAFSAILKAGQQQEAMDEQRRQTRLLEMIEKAVADAAKKKSTVPSFV